MFLLIPIVVMSTLNCLTALLVGVANAKRKHDNGSIILDTYILLALLNTFVLWMTYLN